MQQNQIFLSDTFSHISILYPTGYNVAYPNPTLTLWVPRPPSSPAVLLPQMIASLELLAAHSRENSPALMTLIQMVRNWLNDSEWLSKTLGIEVNQVTAARSQELAELAFLCECEDKPEASWLNAAQCSQLRIALQEIRPRYAEFNNRRKILLQQYDASLLDLELSTLIENFSSFGHRSFLHHVLPQYHKNKRIILQAMRSATLPPTILEDLVEARELARMRQSIDSEYEPLKALLDTYDRAYSTDFGAVERAISVAERAIKLSALGSDSRQEDQSGTSAIMTKNKVSLPQPLGDFITGAATPTSDLALVAKRTQQYAEQWQQETATLSTIVSFNELQTAQDFLLLHQRLESQRSHVSQLLGTYDQGYNTDFEVAQRALNGAKDAIELARGMAFSPSVIAGVAIDAPPPVEILADAQYL